MTHSRSPGRLAQVACLLEATARKPGNVHRYQDFKDCGYLDFTLSALAIGQALDCIGAEGLGTAILEAVRATQTLVSTNTNLGMILLLAPLTAVPEGVSIETGIGLVLESTTIDDAMKVYEAIRLARPGGLGAVPDQDVSGAPTVTLREAMSLAADRDSIARQYVSNFADVLGIAVPALQASLARGDTLEIAIIAAHLTLLSRLTDSLMARKRGEPEARQASVLASQVLAAGWPAGAESLRLCEEFDRWLRAVGHSRNPGTTADLVAAALFVGLREGLIALPIAPGYWHG